MSRSRSAASKLALLVLTSAIACAGCELAFRLIESSLLSNEVSTHQDHYDLGRLGYNDELVPAVAPPGSFRILSVGDSFTYSITPNRSSWNGVVQRLLSERTDRSVRIINLGVRARSFPTYVRQWRFWSKRLAHDAVLFNVYVGNDFSDVHSFRHVRRALTRDGHGSAPGPSSPDLYLRTGTAIELPRWTPLRSLDHLIAAYIRWVHRAPDSEGYLDTTQAPPATYLRSMAAATRPYRTDPQSQAETLDGWVAMADLLDVAEEISAGDRRVAVLLSPPALFFQHDLRRSLAAYGIAEEDLDPDRPRRLAETLAGLHSSRIPVLDLMPCLLRAPDREELYLGTNSHWSIEGNRVVGECLAELLAELWFVPSSNGRRASASKPGPADDSHVASEMPEALGILRERTARDAMRKALGDLAGRRHASEASFEQALGEAGWRRDDTRLRGSFDAVLLAGYSPNAPPTEAAGWFVDLDDPKSRASIWVLADGRIVGFARTAGMRADVSAALGLVSESAGFVAFTVPLMLDCDAVERADLRAYGLTVDGRFRPLSLEGSRRCADGARS